MACLLGISSMQPKYIYSPSYLVQTNGRISETLISAHEQLRKEATMRVSQRILSRIWFLSLVEIGRSEVRTVEFISLWGSIFQSVQVKPSLCMCYSVMCVSLMYPWGLRGLVSWLIPCLQDDGVLIEMRRLVKQTKQCVRRGYQANVMAKIVQCFSPFNFTKTRNHCILRPAKICLSSECLKRANTSNDACQRKGYVDLCFSCSPCSTVEEPCLILMRPPNIK